MYVYESMHQSCLLRQDWLPLACQHSEAHMRDAMHILLLMYMLMLMVHHV